MLNKSALKKFSVNARKELLERVELQARKIGITNDKIEEASVESSDSVFINGKHLTDIERRQRNRLIQRIEEIGFDQVMEETAYTWFNRFIALRFMEVNDYLPTRVRVLSSESEGSTEPDMMKEALSLDLPIDKERVYELKMENRTDELFKYLIKLHCNDLNRYMPFMFESVEDYKEILFPEGLLGKDSFLSELTNTEIILEEDWKEIEIIGWLYQFYIAEEKDRVFKEKKKYKPEEIPFATQLFTPKWIVQYMVQNSLGRYWIEAHPEHEDLKEDWDFFIEHEEDFQEKIEPYIYKDLNIEDIKCFDPAMGSGHILVYMFDVLYEIYSKAGYVKRDIPRLIIENNLYGLDIDDRAYQLAAFSVVMKALEYYPRFLRTIERHGLKLNLASIQETNQLTEEDIVYLAGENQGQTYDDVKSFIEQFKDAKSIGSLIKLKTYDTEVLEERLKEIEDAPAKELFVDEKRVLLLSLLPQLIKQAQIMKLSYDILVTNPPYMSSRSMNAELSNYLKKNYPDSKADLFAAFMEIDHYLKDKGMYAAINQHSWMFLSSFEKLREKVIANKFIDTMLHLGPRTFEEISGEVVQSTAFVQRILRILDGMGTFIRLLDYSNSKEKSIATIRAGNDPEVSYRYIFNQNNSIKIPGFPITYWVSEKMFEIFDKANNMGEIIKPRAGLATGNNKLFQRFWYEVDYTKIGFDYKDVIETKSKKHRWFPCNSGGKYKKWSTNDEYVVDWEDNGRRIKSYRNESGKLAGRPQNTKFYFKKGITWNKLSNENFSIKFKREGFIFDDTSRSAFLENEGELYYVMGILSSKISLEFLKMLNPTMSFTNNDLQRIPYIYSEKDLEVVNELVVENILISKKDWDSYEISWDFNKHPFLEFKSRTIGSSYNNWEHFTISQFKRLKHNEEELNRIFIEIYGLEDELTPEVDDEDVTIHKADLERDIKSFISYAVGCMFGRYSLDEEGLIYAGGEFDPDKYKTFPADEDNILPILPSSSFEDDIVARFIEFVQVTYGEDTLEENLNFIADALGRRKNETAMETIRRYFLNDFYKDHVKTYQKRPIYWLFTSGKEKAFNCLIYMHRYDKTTLSRIRTDYLHEVQARYDTEKADLQAIIESAESTAKEIRDAKKELKVVEKKIAELKEYDEKLHHLADQQIEIDLDDGVKVNYDKFKGLVAKI